MSDSARSWRIAVVGAGAIGGYYGARLAASGHDVHFLMRSDLAVVRRAGLQIYSPLGDLHLTHVNCYARPEGIGAVDLVMIALKTTANDALPDLLPPLLHDRTVLLTLQNGLGNEELLAQHFGEDRVLGGLCFVCLIRTSPGVIEQFDRGHLCVGEFRGGVSERVNALVQSFRASDVDCRAVEDLLLERWRKLVWNIPFNGIAVREQLDTAAILAGASLRSEVEEIMREVIRAARRCGHDLPDNTVAFQLKRTAEMAPYKPSTLIDYEQGKTLELESIWGEPLRRAEQLGERLPRTRRLYEVLRSLNAAAAPGGEISKAPANGIARTCP